MNLPSTEFPLRANAVSREPAIQTWWAQRNTYQRCLQRASGAPFTLHDGPPYANGSLHIGHALNKVRLLSQPPLLQRYIRLTNQLTACLHTRRFLRTSSTGICFSVAAKRSSFPVGTPTASRSSSKSSKVCPKASVTSVPFLVSCFLFFHRSALSAISASPCALQSLTPTVLRKKARNFALEAVEEQRVSFERYGVWADWKSPYLTLAPEYEAAQLEVFAQMALGGHIYRGLKPVHWSPSTGTALAEAELEYPDGHISQSIFVAMDLCFPEDHFTDRLASHGRPSLAIWTTTPWTIPANQAIAVNPDLTYVLATPGAPLESETDSVCASSTASQPARSWSRPFVVAKDLRESLEQRVGRQLDVVCELSGNELADRYTYSHPLFQHSGPKPVVAGGTYITTDSGTGLVHTAPGHGQEDFRTGNEYGLPIASPVDSDGLFTHEVGHKQLEGLSVLGEGNSMVIELLRQSGNLIAKERYEHKYPYDWRSKQPTIFRATEQWFASIDGFRQQALDAIGTVKWYPASGEKRVRGMVEAREDWCISRQRTWGLPIPAFYDLNSGEVLMDQATLNSVIGKVREHGADIWWEWSVKNLLPEEHKHKSEQLEKGMDTMDVWFDSGTSWNAVVNGRDGLQYPADMYLEGSDQHRGWFQSSLLTSVAANGRAPYKEVLTHGFVMDESGNKMSKSLGNVVDPAKVIEGGSDQKKEPGRGADVLRMWVASVDYSSDACLGESIIQQQVETYRKIRGTLRFLLGNLSGFDIARDGVPLSELPSLDRYALHSQAAVHRSVEQAYNSYEFFKVSQQLNQHVTTFLSNFYLDLAKDRLYIRSASSHNRRSCQTVLYYSLQLMTAALAPIAPHTAEDVWQHLPEATDERHAESVFEEGWPSAESISAATEDELLLWHMLLQLREEVNMLVEEARNEKTIRAPLEAQLKVHCSSERFKELAHRLLLSEAQGGNGADELRTVLLVSQSQLCASPEDAMKGCEHTRTIENHSQLGSVTIGVTPAAGHKCERCWNFSTHVGQWNEHPTLCERCAPVVTSFGFELTEEQLRERRRASGEPAAPTAGAMYTDDRKVGATI